MIVGLDGGELGLFCPIQSLFYALRLAERYGARPPVRIVLEDALMQSFWGDGDAARRGQREVARRLDGTRLGRADATRIAEALERARDDLPRHGSELSWEELRPPRNVIEVFAGPMRTFVVDLAEFLHGRAVRMVTFPPPGAIAQAMGS